MARLTAADKRLLQAADEAMAIACGTADPSTFKVYHPPQTVDVKAIRKTLNMTQLVFGERFGFGRSRVRDWEQKRTTPTASDRVLLTTIKLNPDAVLRALETEAGQVVGGDTKPMRKAVARRPRVVRAPVAGRRPKAAVSS